MRPSRPSPPFQVVALLVIASWACSLGGGTAGPPPSSLPGETATSPTESPSTPTPTEEPTEEDIFFDPDEPPPPPQGMFDALQERIDAGEWTLEQGLIVSLQVLAGEVSAEEAFGDRQPFTMEGFGVVVEARRYLRTGADAAAMAEMERLLSIVVPDVDRLMEFALPEEQASLGRAGLASPGLDETCTSIAEKGFPAGSEMVCYLFKQSPLGAYTVRAFYPSSWGKTGPNLAFAQAALQAVFDSHAVYTQYGQIRNVDVVFTLLDTPKVDALAEVTSPGGSNRCEILVYPVALTQAEGNFKQTIAHEMFHCVQQWKFPVKFDHDWGVEDWWGEATAEYFSNVVYPAVNDEWPRLPVFNKNSATRPLVEMSYENWIFFQFLANQIGDSGVLALIDSMPASGTTADQATALAAFPNIQTLFHQFGRDYVDLKIKDASGAMAPTGWLKVPPSFRLTVGPEDHNVSLLSAQPFVLTRYGLVFAPERIYSLTAAETGSAGLNGSRLVLGPKIWEQLPPTVAAGCGEVRYYSLVTSTATAADLYTLAVTADVTQKTKCDPCLSGSWELNKDSFLGYISTPFIQTPDLFQPDDPQGSWRYTFTKDGNMGAVFDFAFAYRLHQTTPSGAIDTDVLMTIEGSGQALYWIPDIGTLTMQSISSNLHMEQTVAMNGEEVASGPVDLFNPFPSSGTGSSTYSCSPGKLFLTMAGSQSAGLPALEYDRVP